MQDFKVISNVQVTWLIKINDYNLGLKFLKKLHITSYPKCFVNFELDIQYYIMHIFMESIAIHRYLHVYVQQNWGGLSMILPVVEPTYTCILCIATWKGYNEIKLFKI